jgi:hypothetical protein
MAKCSFAAVEERYAFELPEVYRSLCAAGHFNHRGTDCLNLIDVEWLTPEDIADYKFLDWQAPHKKWFVPFAMSARRNEWGWRLDWAGGGEPPVAFCERGPEGRGTACYWKSCPELGCWKMRKTKRANRRSPVLSKSYHHFFRNPGSLDWKRFCKRVGMSIRGGFASTRAWSVTQLSPKTWPFRI